MVIPRGTFSKGKVNFYFDGKILDCWYKGKKCCSFELQPPFELSDEEYKYVIKQVFIGYVSGSKNVDYDKVAKDLNINCNCETEFIRFQNGERLWKN